MNPDEYIKQRVDDQIGWYDQKSQRSQWWFKKLRALEIIAAGIIPLFAGFGQGPMEHHCCRRSWRFSRHLGFLVEFKSIPGELD